MQKAEAFIDFMHAWKESVQYDYKFETNNAVSILFANLPKYPFFKATQQAISSIWLNKSLLTWKLITAKSFSLQKKNPFITYTSWFVIQKIQFFFFVRDRIKLEKCTIRLCVFELIYLFFFFHFLKLFIVLSVF